MTDMEPCAREPFSFCGKKKKVPVSPARIERATDGYQYSSYSPPLYQLSYRELPTVAG